MSKMDAETQKSYNAYMVWKNISRNPSMINVLKENIDKIDIFAFNQNPRCFEILIDHPNLIVLHILEKNPNNAPVYMVYPELITWRALKFNPFLTNFINTDVNKVEWNAKRPKSKFSYKLG